MSDTRKIRISVFLIVFLISLCGMSAHANTVQDRIDKYYNKGLLIQFDSNYYEDSVLDPKSNETQYTICTDFVLDFYLREYNIELSAFKEDPSIVRIISTKEWHNAIDKGTCLNLIRKEVQPGDIIYFRYKKNGGHALLVYDVTDTNVIVVHSTGNSSQLKIDCRHSDFDWDFLEGALRKQYLSRFFEQKKDTAYFKITGSQTINILRPLGNYSIETAKVSKITQKTYRGKPIKPKPTVIVSGVVLKEGEDYKLTYSKNSKVGTATVKVSGIGRYSGTTRLSFRIAPSPTTLKTVASGKEKFTAQWSKQTLQTDGYQIQYSRDKSFKIGNRTILTKSNKTVKRTCSGMGKGTYYVRVRTYKMVGSVRYYSKWSDSKRVKVYAATDTSILGAVVTMSKTKYEYTGKELTPKPKVTIKKKGKVLTLKNGKDYKLVYRNNKDTGKATIKIIGINNYMGTVYQSFMIIPSVREIDHINSRETGFGVVWKKKKVDATGYQCQISTSPKFDRNVSSTYYDISSVTKATVYMKADQLLSGETYYIRLRAYKEIEGAWYYSKWSSVKTQDVLYEVADPVTEEDSPFLNGAEIYKDGYYRNVQGICTDGTYLYIACREGGNTSYYDSKPTMLRKIDKKGNVIAYNNSTCYCHANGMTYCQADGKIYIATLGRPDNIPYSELGKVSVQAYNTIAVVNPDTLSCERLISVADAMATLEKSGTTIYHEAVKSPVISSVDYDPYRNLFICMIRPYIPGVYEIDEGDKDEDPEEEGFEENTGEENIAETDPDDETVEEIDEEDIGDAVTDTEGSGEEGPDTEETNTDKSESESVYMQGLAVFDTDWNLLEYHEYPYPRFYSGNIITDGEYYYLALNKNKTRKKYITVMDQSFEVVGQYPLIAATANEFECICMIDNTIYASFNNLKATIERFELKQEEAPEEQNNPGEENPGEEDSGEQEDPGGDNPEEENPEG